MTAVPVPLTTARRGALIIGIPAALAILAATSLIWLNVSFFGLLNQRDVSTAVALTVPLTSGQTRLTTSNADLSLRAGSGHLVWVKGKLTGALKKPTFSHQQTSRGLSLNAYCRVPIGSCSLAMRVTAPTGFPIAVTDSFGDLSAYGLTGRTTLSENSGNMSVGRLSGTLRLSNAFGDITGSGLQGSLWLSNNSGNITVTGASGSTYVQNSFGDITLTGLSAADVTCRDQSGNIMLVLTQVPQRISVSNSFGDISLLLPAGSATYRVQTSNSFGSTTITVPRSPDATHAISVSDQSGNILVSTTKTPPAPVSPPPPGAPAAPVKPAVR